VTFLRNRQVVVGRILAGSARSGYILYLLLSLLLIWAIMTFGLTSYKSGAVNLLSHTSQQSRLICVAEAGLNEIWAIARTQANDKAGKNAPTHFFHIFNSVFDQSSANVPPLQTFSRERTFAINDLPYANILAAEISGNNIEVKGHCRVYFTRLIRRSPQSFTGHIEVLVNAVSRSDRQQFVEIKERRDFKIIDTRDLLDQYALFVKDFGYDYNLNQRKLIVEGLGPQVLSRVYLGSRHAPSYPAFKNIKGPAPIYFDFDFLQNSALIPAVIKNSHSPLPPGGRDIPSSNATTRSASSGNFFWAVPMPLKFKPIYDRGNFSDNDFYSVKALQQGYYNIFVKPAMKSGSSSHSLTALILDDWQSCGGDYASSQVFRMVVATSIDAWNYLYGYTDAAHIWKGSEWTTFADKPEFRGLSDYVSFMKDHHPEKTVAGSMPRIFGATDGQPVILEGNVFLRFFKLAFFDEFSTTLALGGRSNSLSMPAIPLLFQLPGSVKSFLNREVLVHGLEKQLMSREVDEIPVNSLFGDGLKLLPLGVNAPENLFPAISVDSISYRYKNAEQFLAENTIRLADGSKRLRIDGVMYIERGDLDISEYNSFSGQGMIWIGFRGTVSLGDLAKSKPSDILKIFAQDGNFLIKSRNPEVKISASLLALTFFADPKRNRAALVNRGKLLPDNHAVEITGNLAVDYFFLLDKSYGVPAGKNVLIKHDPFLQTPVYPKWATIGPVRTSYSVSANHETRFFK